MRKRAQNFIFAWIIFFISGCASYQIPIQIQNNPTCSTEEISQIELSPILNIGESERNEDRENHVHSQH